MLTAAINKKMNERDKKMAKIVFNYENSKKQHKRVEIYKDAAFATDILYAFLYLHTIKVVNLCNILNISEVICG